MPRQIVDMAESPLTGEPEYDAVRALSKQNKKLVTLYGPNGNGKTHMGSWLFSMWYAGAMYYWSQDTVGRWQPSALWTKANQISAALKNFSRGGFDFQREFELFARPYILMIDDLYAEGASDFDNTNLVELIETRLQHKRRTIITTNLSLVDIAERFSPRLADRMRGGEIVRFNGLSHRGME